MPNPADSLPSEFHTAAGLQVRPTGRVLSEPDGQTARRRRSPGKLFLFDVSQPPTLTVTVAYAQWDNGDRDVRTIAGPKPSALVARLAHGLRISISSLERGISWMELTLATVSSKSTQGQWATPRRATLGEISSASRLSAVDSLLSSGALDVGTRGTLLGDSGPRRNVAAVTFPANSRLVPILAYTLTRILPMLYSYGQGA